MNHIFCLLALLCPLPGLPQTPSVTPISGTVISKDKKPLVGAGLTLVKSKRQFLSGAKGNFTINVSVLPDTLIVTHTGFQTKKIPVGANLVIPLIIEMETATAVLDEVVVNTGYQDIAKERVSGSFAKIDGTLFNRRISTNVLERLEGIVPGLVFNRNTVGSASGKIDISIRGQSTLFANAQPLVVVDNFPYDGDIANLNAADVESVTVLKDAAAASIWGARSGNGVIVITTKKGKINQPLSVNLNTNLSFGARPDLFYSRSFLPASPFIDLEQELFNRGYYNTDLNNTSHPPISPVVELLARQQAGLISSQYLNSQLDALRTIDARNDVSRYLYRPSINQQYALSLRGGGRNTSYSVSGGSDINSASITGNSYQRQTFSSQLNFLPIDKLELSFSLNHTRSETITKGITNLTTGGPSAKGLLPYARLADDTGNALALVRDYRSAYLDTAGGGLLADWHYRPLNELNNTDQSNRLTDTRVALGAKYTLPIGLQAELRYQQENAVSSSRIYYSPQSYYARNLINSLTVINGTTLTRPIPAGGILDKSGNEMLSQRLRAQLNYSGTFGLHRIIALAGAEISKTNTNRFAHRWYGYNDAIATSIPVDYTSSFKQFVSGGNARIPNPDALGETDNRFLSYFANAAYTYRSRYSLTGSGRIDKSNFFGVSTNDKQVPLYSFGGVWNMSKEPWYSLHWLPDLKFRISYGFNANLVNNLTAFTTATYSTSSPYYSGQPYATITSPANASLRWEKIRMINTAIEFGLADRRLTGSLEYYFKKGIDLAGESPLSPSSGFSSFTGNYAQTVGQGFDLVLQGSLPLTSQFRWDSYFLLSGVWDKVTRYDVPATSGAYILYGYGNAGTVYPLQGKPLYSQYSYQWGGLDPTNGDPMGYLDGKLSKDYAAIITKTPLDSMVFNGRTRPVVTASWRQELSWRHWSLSINMVAKLGYVFRCSSISYGGLFSSWSGNADYLQRWKQPGDETRTQVPSLQYPPVNSSREQFYGTSEALIEKADHIRLQDIRLTWLWEKTPTGKLPFKQFELSFYINNLGILWRANQKGLDPDLFANSMPLPISISIGLNAHF